MPVTRSAFASRAACSAMPANASFVMPAEAGISCGRADPPSPETPAFAGVTTSDSTSHRASFATRSTLSATVPSFSWKTIPSSFFALSASGTFRSCSQKKRASERRAASTLALPATIAAPPSAASILAVQTKLGASFPTPSTQAKYFWLVRMVSWITSGGTSRKAGSNPPSSGTGHSVSPAFSATSPSSGETVSPAAAAASAAPSRMIASRSSAERMTWQARSLAA